MKATQIHLKAAQKKGLQQRARANKTNVAEEVRRKERLAETNRRSLSDVVMDHEKRLIRIESSAGVAAAWPLGMRDSLPIIKTYEQPGFIQRQRGQARMALT